MLPSMLLFEGLNLFGAFNLRVEAGSQVIEALSNAPLLLIRLPIDLLRGQASESHSSIASDRLRLRDQIRERFIC